MRWTGGLNEVYAYNKEKARLQQWHKWFAWRPVVVDITIDNKNVYAWMEIVYRKGTYTEGVLTIPGYWTFIYARREGVV
jgi:hypothetical protein